MLRRPPLTLFIGPIVVRDQPGAENATDAAPGMLGPVP